MDLKTKPEMGLLLGSVSNQGGSSYAYQENRFHSLDHRARSSLVRTVFLGRCLGEEHQAAVPQLLGGLRCLVLARLLIDYEGGQRE